VDLVAEALCGGPYLITGHGASSGVVR
jgi:hypothetical protein